MGFGMIPPYLKSHCSAFQPSVELDVRPPTFVRRSPISAWLVP